jgi:anaerobic dimethyl sulfoxide reductase subunit C (anchor subunit)
MNLREWALPVYTILMQLAVGCMAAFWIIRAFFLAKFGEEELERMMRNPVAILLITILIAMVGSFFHLSRPYLSFMALINLGKSWLSREIVFTVLLCAAVAVLWYLQANVDHRKHVKTILGWAAIVFGLSATFCMTQLYLLPTQASWDTPFTILSFYSSTALLGAGAGVTMLTVDMRYTQILNPQALGSQPKIFLRALPGFTLAIIFTVAAILAQYGFLIQTLSVGGATAQASLELYLGLYQPLFIFRLFTMMIGAGWMVTTMVRTLRNKVSIPHFTFHAYMACLLLLVGEILGRFLFYATHIRLGL